MIKMLVRLFYYQQLFKPTRKQNIKIVIAIASLWVLKKIAGWVSGRIVLPAQWISKTAHVHSNTPIPLEIQSNLSITQKSVITRDNYKLDTLEIAHTATTENSPHVIIFCGNYASFNLMIPNIQEMAAQHQWKVIAFDYPNVGKSEGVVVSQQALINAGIAQVERLLKLGISPENITLYGMSLGGAVATLVAEHFHTLPQPEKIYLVNDRSFASIGHMATVRYGEIFSYILRPLAHVLHWTLNAARAYENIPDKHKILFVAKEDMAIPYKAASLFENIKPNLRIRMSNVNNYYKTFSHTVKVGNAHEIKELSELHSSSITVLKDRFGNSMSETLKLFVERQLNPQKLIERGKKVPINS